MDAVVSHVSSLLASVSVAGVIRDPKSLFALLIATVMVTYGLSVGRTRALVSLLSIYVAYVLTVLFPYLPSVTDRVPERYHAWLDCGLFFVLYVIVFMLISHSMRRTRLSLGEISLLQVLLISVVQIGLLASIAVSLLPAELTSGLSGPMRVAITGGRALWAWAVASLLILPLMRARRRE